MVTPKPRRFTCVLVVPQCRPLTLEGEDNYSSVEASGGERAMSVYNGGTYNQMVDDCKDDALAARFKVSAVRDFADRKALQMADVIDHLQKEAGVVLPAEVLVALLAPPSSQALPPVAQGQPAAAPRAAGIADPRADAAAIPASVDREAMPLVSISPT